MGQWRVVRACTTAAVALAVLVAGSLLADGAGAARADVSADRIGSFARLAQQAKPAKPARLKVRRPWTNGSNARVTLTWRKSRRAMSYQVFYDRARTMNGAKSVRTRKARRTLRGLHPARKYCFQVRAVRGKGKNAKYGAMSRVVCKRTPRRVGRAETAWVVAQRIENTPAGPRTALTVRWDRTRGARSYALHVGPKYDVQRSRARSVRRGYRATRGAHQTHVLRGLLPGRRYCFQVQGRSRRAAGPPSSSHCKITMPVSKALRPTRFAVKVATYNICGNAAPCQRKWRWTVRRPHVLHRILASGADVVAIQETRRVLSQVVADVKPHGFIKACSFANAQALLVRSSAYTVLWNSTGGIRFAGDRSHGGCWAKLRHRATGSLVAVASLHLKKGRGPGKERAREKQTAQVLARMQGKYGVLGARTTPPFVLAGDFNSHRGHAYDAPRVRLSKYGLTDAYDVAASYEAPNRNSANQYRRTPLTSLIWGSHVDRVFVPQQATVAGWRTVARLRAGRYVAPIPSDHNPVAVGVYLPVTGTVAGGPVTGGVPGGDPGDRCLLGLLCF